MADEHTIPVPIPDDDERRDYRGMYEDIGEAVGEDVVDRTLVHNLKPQLANLIEQFYDNRDSLAERIEHLEGGDG